MSDTRRIAKNTLMLYFRQILIMLVSLYTVRVVLNVLGAEDYGIYNVVAGVVVLFSFVNGAMATGTQRFLNYSLGENDFAKTRKIYSASLVIHAGICGIFVIFAETVGLWFADSKLNLPESRHFASLIVYQFTIVTSVFNILRVPYNAVIIAYEHMSFFAWISILEAILKLSIAFLISHIVFDALSFYSLLLTVVSFIILVVFKAYCNAKFETAHFSKLSDKSLIKELVSFSGWSLFGVTANVSTQQGTNIVLNMFTNVTVNAAMGIANQVNSAVYSFVSNFQTAFNPQLVKTYAAADKKRFMDLINLTSKVSFLLLHIIVLPLFLNAEFVLSLWLKNVPDYSVDFVKLILIWSLIDALNAPLWTAVQATGCIRTYQLVVSTLIFLNLPCCIFAFLFGASPLCVLLIRIILAVIITVWRIFYLQRYVGFSAIHYCVTVIFRCLVIFFVSFLICQLLYGFFSMGCYMRFFLSCSLTVLVNALLFFTIGATKAERKFCAQILKNRIKRV